MQILPSLILTLSIIAGQLIKVPISPNSGLTFLDITVILLCLVGIVRLKFKLKKPPLFIGGGLVFIFVAILSLIFTPLHLDTSEYLISFFYTIRLFSYIILGWFIVSGAFPTLRKNIPRILIFSGLSLAILGLLQFIFLPDLRFMVKYGWDPHYFRTASTFLDPNFLSAYLVFTLLLLFQKRSNWAFFITYAALTTAFSRSGYAMFLISFLSLAFLKRSVKIAVLSIILFALFLLSFKIYIQAVNRITPLDREQTAGLRITTWQQGLNLFQKNPILGVGYNAYHFAIREYQLGDQRFLSGKGSTFNDSGLLHILSTTGVLGLIAYFLFLFGLVKSKSLSLKAAVPGILAHSFFVNSLFYPFILIWIILAASSSYDKQAIK